MESKIQQDLKDLNDYIELGKKQIEKVKNKNIIIFMGNTGSGKSTLVNYIHGCEMEEISLDSEEIVIQVKKNSVIPELMKIGHSNKSETFMPDIKIDQNGIIYVDLPGFFDNRGQIISIANAVNIKNLVKVANTIKIVILVNYHSLMANRKAGEAELLKILSVLFGNEANINENKDSIIINISHLSALTCGRLKDLDSLKKTAFTTLQDRITTSDPLENPLAGGLKRKDLTELIYNLKPVVNSKALFNTLLNEDDKDFINKMGTEISKIICDSMKFNDYDKPLKYLNLLKSFEIIDHPYIDICLGENVNSVKTKIKNIVSNFYTFCAQENFSSANTTKTLLEELYQKFNLFSDISNVIKLSDLSAYYNSSYNKMIERVNYQNELRRREEEARRRQASVERKIKEAEEKIEKEKNEKRKRIQQEKQDLINSLGGPAWSRGFWLKFIFEK